MPDTERIKNEVELAMEEAGCLYEYPGYWLKSVGDTTLGIMEVNTEENPCTLDEPGVFYAETDGEYELHPCTTTREAVQMLKDWKPSEG